MRWRFPQTTAVKAVGNHYGLPQDWHGEFLRNAIFSASDRLRL
ncbi:MAG: hypothetical protein JW719_00780 [Pirellulales bacterium]|nr:hypothetical protein [Pirellulales bacterium]